MEEVKKKSKKFVYATKVKWLKERVGRVVSSGKPVLEISTPPEFGGKEGIWAPEELFIASVNSCVMTTFLYFANKEKLKFVSFESEAEGILERSKRGFWFSQITLYPKIEVANEQMIEKAKALLETAKTHCLISNSIETKVIANPKLVTKERM